MTAARTIALTADEIAFARERLAARAPYAAISKMLNRPTQAVRDAVGIVETQEFLVHLDRFVQRTSRQRAAEVCAAMADALRAQL